MPSAIPGFHASWYGQSGYMSLCAGGCATATVAYYNTGSSGWVVAVLNADGSAPRPTRPSPASLAYMIGDGVNGARGAC